MQMAQAAGEYEDAEYHETFLRRRQADLRELFRAGRGAWYVAVLDGKVVGSLGIVVTGERARYQAVDTARGAPGQGHRDATGRRGGHARCLTASRSTTS